MVPGIVSEERVENPAAISDGWERPSKPLRPHGALKGFEFEECTPVIGREYPSLNLVNDVINAPDADELIRDLAITISQRGVVFFRSQDNLTNDLQKNLINRLGLLTGKPSTSSLHVHPIVNSTITEVKDSEISHIDSSMRKKMFRPGRQIDSRKYDSAVWHSDVQYEPRPADYTSLRVTELPSTGGDTLWASAYELYDRFSPAYQKFFDGLTATFIGEGVLKVLEKFPGQAKIYDHPRGSPENVGETLTTTHPLIRTNPVTGWKSIFAIGPFAKHINELSGQESTELKIKLQQMIYENHDLQCRFRWRNKNDFAIWDNRSTFHTATFDYDGYGERFGYRAVGIGETPYFDPNSQSRTEALLADPDMAV